MIRYLLALPLVASAPELASARPHRNTNINVNDDGQTVTSCDQLRIQFDQKGAVRAEEERVIPAQAGQKLAVRAAKNGGVSVSGGTGTSYRVKLCKAAPADEPDLLGQIRLAVDGDRVGVKGPSGQDQDWIAYLVVIAPKGANLDLQASNGPIAVHGYSGEVTARAANGPIDLERVAGRAKIETENGPINLEGCSGDHRLSAANGPINVKLTGDRWQGAGLDASTQNGPLQLRLPDVYRSVVRVDISEHSPVQCRARQCSEAGRSWSEPNRIQFGVGDPVVRLSTVNGPVSIKPGR